ncbi:DUF2171 domain-containing protein [Sphingomonas sanxanigenens]|uniref:DUF2171 domain-containing protein n=1 Tax=Sphingomonas sanxanigenens DSM 19645 = NX02 TaxID=1123269 RepID=W0AGA3_9SPHN|nr:DUF2171 domain-containing protein [Sphingomonas sanxanigenens]AHE56136.1 hypothetical protein NX02_22585 [Sphingomonas sanxanigenens DSM 19645 = NX02]
MGYERNDRFRDRYRDEDRQGYGHGYGREQGGYRGENRYGGFSDRDARLRGQERDDRGYGRSGYGRSDYGRPADYDYDERGFLSRAGDEVRSWFGDDEAERRREYDHRYDERYEREQGYGDRYGSGYGTGRAYGRSYGGYGEERGRTRDWGEQRGAADRDVRSRHRDRGHDDDSRGSYVEWRERQNSLFDQDYDEYRREHQSKFDTDFANWRTRRETQRGSLALVTEHMEVVGSDGVHVGIVDKVRGDRILLTKNDKDAGGHHHSIPSRWIDRVDDRVILEKTAQQAQSAWRDEEDRQALFGDKDERRGTVGTDSYTRSF